VTGAKPGVYWRKSWPLTPTAPMYFEVVDPKGNKLAMGRLWATAGFRI
jgi:hypothetical protein